MKRGVLLTVIAVSLFFAMSVVAFPDGAAALLVVLGLSIPALLIFRRYADDKEFITNVFLSNILFRVAIDAYSQLATYLILAGNVTVVLFSSWNPRTNFSTSDLIRLWYRNAYLFYLLAAVVMICVFQFGYVQIGRAQGRYQLLQSRLSNP